MVRHLVGGALALLTMVPVISHAQFGSFWTPPNVVDRLKQDGRFTTLLTAVELAGLTDTLKSGGPFTVFAPTDDAFAALPAGTLDALVQDIPTLKNILLYHVLGRRDSSFELLVKSTAKTLQGNPVLVVSEHGRVKVNQATVTRANVWASNGLIHVINSVLLPPQDAIEVKSMVDVLKLDGRFKTLLAALDAAGLTDTVASAPALTLFAPTDDAFGALPPGTVESLLADTDALKNVLLYHVLGEKRGAIELVAARQAQTLQESTVSIQLRDWKVFINDAPVLNANVNTPNGFIHTLGKVLLPPAAPADLVEVLTKDGRFKTLLAAVEAADLVDVLKTGGPFTLFAPTDDAFGALPAGTVEALLADPDALKNVLLYHLVSGESSLGELREQREVATLQGDTVSVRGWYKGKATFINRSLVIKGDVDGGNGVIHVINRVLLPPAN
jgi:transforming growth factor-beta-induced protein